MTRTVSAIIPTIGKRPEMLKEAIESIKNQIEPVLEILIMDFKDSAPGNCARRLNQGVRQSKGEFFFFMGDDDILKPNFTQRMLDEFEKNDKMDVVTSWFENFGDESGIHGPEKFPLCSTMVRRSVYDKTDGYDEKIPMGLDADFYFQCFEAGAQWIIIPDILYRYRIHPNQLSNTGDWANYKELIRIKYDGKYSHL